MTSLHVIQSPARLRMAPLPSCRMTCLGSRFGAGVLLCVVSFLCLTSSWVGMNAAAHSHAKDDASPLTPTTSTFTAATGGEGHPFIIRSSEALMETVAGVHAEIAGEGLNDSASSHSPPSAPTLLLFVEADGHRAAAEDPLLSAVRRLATDIPRSVLRVHAYAVPKGGTERRLTELLLPAVTTLPALVLFNTEVSKALVLPGALLVPNPLYVPVYCPSALLRSANYVDLRTWALSEMPTRYVDPVTLHLIPSLQFVFHQTEVQDTISTVRNEVEGKAARSAAPLLVAMAYLRLTRHGSEELVAAFSSVAAQAGNAVLTLVTESPDVASGWGLTEEHTLTMAPWESVVKAYASPESFASPAAVIVSDTFPPEVVGTVTELAEATAASAAWRAARAALTEAEHAQLQSWQQNMEAYNTTSPLRKIDSVEQFFIELGALYAAIKVVFVLREGDELWFHHHLDVATDVAQRLRATTVTFRAMTPGKAPRGKRARSGVELTWTPKSRTEIFWMDAEQLPALADSLYVSQVPSVLILLPLQFRFGDRTRAAGEVEADTAAGEMGTQQQQQEEEGVRSHDPLVGCHVVSHFDLLTVPIADETQAAQGPTSGKEAQPLFPTDADALIRFLASATFFQAAQQSLQPIRLSSLQAKVAKGLGFSGMASHPPPLTCTRPNRCYRQLDRRYYVGRAAEEPFEGPSYVRQILNGTFPLPTAERDAEGRHHRTSAGLEGTAARNGKPAGRTHGQTAAVTAEKKAAWEATLAKRRQAKEERVRRKAAADAADRERQQIAFQQEVNTALKAVTEGVDGPAATDPGAVASRDGTERGVSARDSGGSLLVRRPWPGEEGAGSHPWVSHRSGPDGGAGAPPTEGDSGDSGDDDEDVEERRRRRVHHQEYKEWLADRELMATQCVAQSAKGTVSLKARWA